ncbi:LysR family transcriptional regulator [Acidithiobacillus albertensis]|uniref:LysR family transcriptional regulator n=1 Tax=Acidithiobacillus albertensis TaxID=119978 RepID=UPI00094B609A|nr:LysR family transcriptional regulator [Acidithiobacillus albertensis]
MLHQRIDPVLLLVWAQAARHGNLHAAAESLFMTQPAVSHRLKNLQEIVGEPLYQRNRHGITPTAMGMALLRIAEQIENALEDARHLCQDTEKMLRGSLSILASHSNAETLLPQAIARFQQQYPGVSLRLIATNSRAARAMRDQADLVFVEDDLASPAQSEWVQETLRETTIVLLAPENPHWLQMAQKPLPLQELGSTALVWREEGSGIREHALQALKDAGIYPEIRYELSGLAAIRDAVRCGLGVSFVSALNDSGGQRPGLITLNTEPQIRHRLSVLYRKEASHSSRAFLELLRQPAV